MEETLGEDWVAKFLTAAAGLCGSFCKARADAAGLIEATFGAGVIEAKAIGAAEVEVNAGVGRIKFGGALKEFNGLLIVLAFPGVGGVLKQARERSGRNQAKPFHG